MPRSDHYVQRARNKPARDRRLAEARAVVAKLLPDERDELIIELLAAAEQGDAPGEELRSPAAPTQRAIEAVGADQRVRTTKPDGYFVKDAILDAVRDGKARTAGEINHATKAMHPWVNEKSIPAAIARMATEMDPPLLIRHGKNDQGHPTYVIAQTETPQ